MSALHFLGCDSSYYKAGRESTSLRSAYLQPLNLCLEGPQHNMILLRKALEGLCGDVTNWLSYIM